VANAGTILVADDQASFRDSVTRLLTKRGFRVLQAADGRQALATAQREKPDAMVVDVVMPHMDGVEMCRQLRADPSLPYIPVLFHSRRDQTRDVVTALRAGGDDFVPKGTEPDELVARVEVLVRIRRLLGAGPQRETKTAPVSTAERGAPLTELLGDPFDRAQVTGRPLSLLLVEPERGGGKRLGQGELSARLAVLCEGAEVVAPDKERAVGVVLADTHFGGALAAAEKVWRDSPPSNTSSGLAIGVACFPNRGVTGAADLIAFARAALDRARAEGPAHICLYQHQAYIFRPE
jgi:CheY-like chemotaxis protein